MAARKIRVLYPVQRKSTMVAIAMWLAQDVGVPRDRTEKPRFSRTALISPDWSANSLEKIRPTATGATTKGSRTPMRQNVLERRFWSSTAARARAVITWGTEDSRKMLNVLRSPVQNSGAVTTSW